MPGTGPTGKNIVVNERERDPFTENLHSSAGKTNNKKTRNSNKNNTETSRAM